MKRLTAFALAALCLALWTATGAALTVVDLNTPGITARSLAQALMPGVVTLNETVQVNATNRSTGTLGSVFSNLSAAGTFTGGLTSGFGIESGIILSTGAAQSAAETVNFGAGLTTDFSQDGDSFLDALIPALDRPTFDAAVLEFDFVPTSGTVTFRYVMASDEFFQGAAASDVFSISIDGNNIAFLPGGATPVSVTNIDTVTPAPFFIDNFTQIPSPFPNPYDGFTTVLTATAGVTAGVPHHAKIAIADALDGAIDTTVLIASGVPARFNDVPPGGFAFTQIEAIAAAGITGGCSTTPPLYCPTATITRGQMAVFIERSLGKSPTQCAGNVFSDVSAASVGASFCAFIEQLARDGITGGCGGGLYCPNQPVTRGQMAVFIERALGKTPTQCAGNVFSDVTAASVGPGFCAFIEQLARDGVTGGCGGGNYCPNNPVTRAEMAVFLVAAPPPLLP